MLSERAKLRILRRSEYQSSKQVRFGSPDQTSISLAGSACGLELARPCVTFGRLKDRTLMRKTNSSRVASMSTNSTALPTHRRIGGLLPGSESKIFKVSSRTPVSESTCPPFLGPSQSVEGSRRVSWPWMQPSPLFYGFGPEILACEQAGIKTYVPSRFSKADFIYFARDDEYQCPAGERLSVAPAPVERRERHEDRYILDVYLPPLPDQGRVHNRQ